MINVYRQNAALARAEADVATLDNVRSRCLRAAAAWAVMAERQERVERARVRNRDGITSTELTEKT